MKNWQFWILVLLLIISSWVISYQLFSIKSELKSISSDQELMREDIISNSNDLYWIKNTINSYGTEITKYLYQE